MLPVRGRRPTACAQWRAATLTSTLGQREVEDKGREEARGQLLQEQQRLVLEQRLKLLLHLARVCPAGGSWGGRGGWGRKGWVEREERQGGRQGSRCCAQFERGGIEEGGVGDSKASRWRGLMTTLG